MDEKSLRLLKVMREQLGETSASRAVDAVAAAGSLGMYPGTLDRSLHELIRAGYIEESANPAVTTQGLYLLTWGPSIVGTKTPDLFNGHQESGGLQPLNF